MGFVEIIAGIFAVIILVKMVQFLIFKPKQMIKWIDKKFKDNRVVPYFFLVLAIVIGYFLLQTMSIVQIAAAGFLVACLYGFSFLLYPNEYIQFAKKVISNRKNLWLLMGIWTAFAVWVLYAIFV